MAAIERAAGPAQTLPAALRGTHQRVPHVALPAAAEKARRTRPHIGLQAGAAANRARDGLSLRAARERGGGGGEWGSSLRAREAGNGARAETHQARYREVRAQRGQVRAFSTHPWEVRNNRGARRGAAAKQKNKLCARHCAVSVSQSLRVSDPSRVIARSYYTRARLQHRAKRKCTFF